MTRSVLFRIAVAALLLAVTISPAGVREKGYEAGIYGGIQNGDNNENISSDSAFGIKFGYAISRKIMVELNANKFDTAKEIFGLAGDPALPANQVPYKTEIGASFLSYTVGMTANFLTDRETKTTPYISVGLGAITEERDPFQLCVDVLRNDTTTCADVRPDGTLVDPNAFNKDPNGVSFVTSLKDDDTGTALSFAAGARTFLTPWFAIRYEGRWYHHDTYSRNQDAFELSVGSTFIFGGKK